MSDQTPRRDLTDDQVVYLYERQVNWAILWVALAGFACVGLGILLFVRYDGTWLRWLMLGGCVLVGGFAQRLIVLQVRCPSCGARVLGRIHSVFQAKQVHACPACDRTLRR
jgi:hypothetical protein